MSPGVFELPAKTRAEKTGYENKFSKLFSARALPIIYSIVVVANASGVAEA